MDRPAEGHVLAEAFSLVTARRTGMNESDFGTLIAQVYNDCIEPGDPETSTLRRGLLLVQLARIAADALDRWAELDPQAVEEYTTKLVNINNILQADS